jgi:hypothetical protein
MDENVLSGIAIEDNVNVFLSHRVTSFQGLKETRFVGDITELSGLNYCWIIKCRASKVA